VAIPTTTTTEAPTTTAPVQVTRPSRPVAAPREAYAVEPIVEIGTIEIPKIGLNHRIMHGISMRNIDNGPSHWPGTAMPGEAGNTVFAGHRVTHTHPFLRINELAPGDLVIFHVNGLKSTYNVTGSEVVYPDNLGIVNQTETATGTLFACHPPHSARQRYVVHLALVDSVLEQ
jgi:sortase A